MITSDRGLIFLLLSTKVSSFRPPLQSYVLVWSWMITIGFLRMDNIAEEAPSRAATLRALLAHATARAYIAELEDKVGVSRFDLVGSL